MLHNSLRVFPFQFVSDLHLEFRKRLPVITRSADNLLLAGDIGDPSKMLYKKFFQQVSSSFDRVFYVAGNHEYYSLNRTMKETKDLIREVMSSLPNVHFLDNEYYDLPFVRIVGSTLWTNVGTDTPLINDNYRIFVDPTQQLSLEKTRQIHQESVSFLTKTINESPSPVIVLTHHLPSYVMIHPNYKHSPYNPHFASSLDHMFRPPVKAWVCGHSHGFKEETIHGIPCLLNAVGYPLEHFDYKGIVL